MEEKRISIAGDLNAIKTKIWSHEVVGKEEIKAREFTLALLLFKFNGSSVHLHIKMLKSVSV